MAVAVAELGVAVAAVGVLLGVFLPEQLLGHPLALEFLVESGPVRYCVACGRCGVSTGVEQPRQLAVVQIVWQWPGEPQLGGLAQQFLENYRL